MGKDLGIICYPNQSKEEWGNHQYSDPHHQQGRREWSGPGDSSLSPQSSQDGGLWCPLHPVPAWLSWAWWWWWGRIPTLPTSLGEMSHALYLDMGTFSGGGVSAQFPLDRLYLCWLLPFSEIEVLLPSMVGGEGLEMYPNLPEFLWVSSEEEHLSFWSHLSVILSPAPSSLLEVCTQSKGGLDSHPASTQTEGGLGCHPAGTLTEGLGYYPSLKLLQEASQAWAQLECELIWETQELAEKCKHKWAKQARRHARRRAQMINQTDATLQEVLSQVSSTKAVKVLPWCVSTGGASPLYKLGCNWGHSTGWGCLYCIQTLPNCTWAWVSQLASSRSIWGSDFSTSHVPSTSVFLTRHPPVKMFFCWTNNFSKGKVGPLSQWLTQPSSH